MSKLENWLLTYSSRQTRMSYSSCLKKFFIVVYGEDLGISRAVDLYLEERKGELEAIKDDLTTFWIHLKDSPPKTTETYFSIIRSFLRDHHLELSSSFWKKFKRRRKGRVRAATKDKISTSKDLRRIFAHLPNGYRPLFSLMAASGTRIGETLAIRLEDLDLDSSPPRIYLQGEYTKNGLDRTVFFTGEAREQVLEWLRVREKWVDVIEARTLHTPIFYQDRSNDPRVFPFSKSSAHGHWRNALKDSGLYERDKITPFCTRRPHTLRKRFRTQLGAVIPVDIVEELMGHEGYTTDAYRRYTEQELADHYQRGEHVLYLSSDRAEVERLQRDVSRQKRELDEDLEEMKREMAEIKALLAKKELSL